MSGLYPAPTLKLTTTIYLVHPTLYLMLEALIFCPANPYHEIFVITNHVEPLIINFYKGLLCLIPYFPFFVAHVIFLVTVNNICIGLLSYILQDESIGRLSLYSIISPLVVPHISYLLFWLWIFLYHLFVHTVLVGSSNPIHKGLILLGHSRKGTQIVEVVRE